MRRSLFFAVPLLFAALAVALMAVKARADDRAAPRAADLVALSVELISRHPDLDLSDAGTFLNRYQGLSDGSRRRELPALEELYTDLLQRCRLATLGSPEPGPELVLLKTFSPNGFGDFYERLSFVGTSFSSEPSPITGEAIVDRRIRSIAERRGYRLRAQAAEEALVAEGRHRLHPIVWESLDELQVAAQAEGVNIEVVSAYRSPARQREIFLGLLAEEGRRRQGRAYSSQEIVAGLADVAIDTILQTASIPGYSKHHTGYTIDVTDPESGLEFTKFGLSDGFRWLSAHNYYNAKRFGFLPSYPDGAHNQGPDPEPWEYVWVGRDLLSEPGPDSLAEAVD
jgi:D-alanyl-D-alanine carboxypeptidase